MSCNTSYITKNWQYLGVAQMHQIWLQILKYWNTWNLEKFFQFSYKNTKLGRIEPLTVRSSSKVLYYRVTMTVLSWTIFKPSIFSFPFLPTAMHIIPKYISNMYLIFGVCNTKTAPKNQCVTAIFMLINSSINVKYFFVNLQK